MNEEEDAREGVALMEGALEELEQARDLLISLEQKVRDHSPCPAGPLLRDAILCHAGIAAGNGQLQYLLLYHT